MTVPALKLDPSDDVAIVLVKVADGKRVVLAGSQETLTAVGDVPIHHKIALHDLPTETPLKRGGLVIGKTKQAIRRGAHVHVHNLTSLRATTRVVFV